MNVRIVVIEIHLLLLFKLHNTKNIAYHIVEVLIFHADKLLVMGNSKNLGVFNFAILLKSRKFDAHKIYVFYSMFVVSCYIFSERELKFMLAICHRPSVCRLSVCLSVICNVGAPYSGDWNFPQYFYTMWYLGHPWPLYKNFTEIVSGEPLRRGELNTRGVAEYSDFGPIERYISETVQDRS